LSFTVLNLYNLSGLFNPEAFITATRQCVPQANSWSLEELHLDVCVADEADKPSFDDCREKQALIQGENAISMEDWMMSVRLRDKSVGLMTWVSRDMAMDRLGIVKMGPKEGRVARKWALLAISTEISTNLHLTRLRWIKKTKCKFQSL
jgi:hypothetical protein